MLDAAVNGDETSTLFLSKLVPQAPTAKNSKLPPVPRETSAVVEVMKKDLQGGWQKPEPFRRPAPYPGAPRVLDERPRLVVPGRRHIPKLVSATGIPFLRFKKPQSPFLGRVLRDKFHQRINNVSQMRAMNELHEVAVLEDIWDKVLHQMHGLPAGPMAGEETWEQGIDYSRTAIWKKLKMQERKRVDTAQRMQKIVDEEKELARKERIQIKRESKSRERGSAISVEARYSKSPIT